MRIRRPFFSRLGVQITAAFIIISIFAGTATGGLVFIMARETILDAEQERLLSVFQSDTDSLRNSISIETTNQNTTKLEDLNIIYMTAADQIGAQFGPQSVVTIPSKNISAGNLDQATIPTDFQKRTAASVSISYWRTSTNGKWVYFVGIPKTIDIVPTSTDLLGNKLAGKSMPTTFLFFSRYSLESQKNQLNALSSYALLAIAVVSAIAATFGILMSYYLMRPLHRVREAIQEIATHPNLPVVTRSRVFELNELISTFNEMAGTLRATMGRLIRSEADSKRFVADVSHELRTPITAMLATVEALDMLPRDPENAREVRLLLSSSERLFRLTEDLLELSKLDSNTGSLYVEEFDIGTLINNLITDVRHAGKIDFNYSLTLITSDKRRIHVILSNFVQNAIRHGLFPIEIQMVPNMHGITVSVTDHGLGIAGGMREDIFKRFFKAEHSRTGPGAGLGLSLTQSNADLIGATITLESLPGQTTFSIIIPDLTGQAIGDKNNSPQDERRGGIEDRR